MHIYLVWTWGSYKAIGLSISAPCAEGIIERAGKREYGCFHGKMAYILYLGNLWHITLHPFDNPKKQSPDKRSFFPSSAHIHGFFPSPKLLLPILGANLWFENLCAYRVDVLQRIETLPNTNREASRDRRTECSRLQHPWTFYWDPDEIGLCL